MKTLFFGMLLIGLTAMGADTADVRSDAVRRFSALLSGTPQEKAALAQTLGAAKDEGAVDTLAKAALDTDPVVAYAAADALGAIGTEKAADALLQAWAKGSPAALANGLLRCAEARWAAKDAARAQTLYQACSEKGVGAQKAAALLGLASLKPQSAAAAKPSALKALRDESALVRLVGIHEAVRAADPEALPVLFELSMKAEEDGRAATLALSAMSAKETDTFLYGELKKAGPGRVKAIELLAARGQQDLVKRLCDATLYDAAGVGAAAGSAWRTCLRQEDFAPALSFVFGPLPAQRREPLVSALAAAVQQLPDAAAALRDVAGALAKADAAGKAELMTLLAGLQTEGSRDLLVAQTQAADVELRKAAVRVLSQWNSPLAVAPLLGVARQDADRTVKILAVRGVLTLLQKPKVMEKDRQLAVMSELAGVAERIDEKKAIYAQVKQMGGPQAEALRKQLAEACGLANVQEFVVAAVNAGGEACGAFKADTGFSGGSAFAVNLPADTSDASDAAPEAVYQSCRFQDMTYTFDGLKAGQPYTLRLHFAETFHEQAGARVFDVAVNGKAMLTDYDIVAKAGKKMKAVTEAVEVTADAAGKLIVTFKTKRDQALVNGLEVLEAGGAATEATGGRLGEPSLPVAKPGQLRVLLLAGANNHNWQETTAALKAIFAESPLFAVAVVEKPWEMKPADIEGYDLIFCNWNTFGSDKREWSAEMKAGFIAWVKKGGGFFVLHAGGSMFYDWEEFQSLTGGAWEKDTFHPQMQAFTVHIADQAHPVMRGLKDFETFDEPWQKIGNRNPNRRVLATGVVSKENKGSGEPEPFVFVTELGKGRCFNLVLGHDGKALGNAGCKTLILRGSEWAAKGDVVR